MTRERPPLPRLLSPRQLFEQTGVPATTWYTVIARGEIPAVKIGRSVRVSESDARAYIQARTERAAP